MCGVCARVNCGFGTVGGAWVLWCVYCVCLCVCVLGVLGVAVRVCCLAEKSLFYLLPHVPMARFDRLSGWFVVIGARE